MLLRSAAGALFVLLAAPVAGEADAADVTEKLEICMSCHGETGNAEMPGVPPLAGLPASYLVTQLRAYRDQSRQNPQMLLARRLADTEIDALAAFFAAQTPAAQQPAAQTNASK
jgi:cytochrome c553